MKQLRELFETKITRSIPPVVYFHEQDPAKLASEVSEYIVTGGYRAHDTRYSRVRDGIHDQYVRLLQAISRELDDFGAGEKLPNCWISGFYGSGKSSFAKLLGLSLDGLVLPDGRLLADAWRARDTTPLSEELDEAWRALMGRLQRSMAVVFDIGGVSRGEEHIHEAVLRQIQRRLGYCGHPAVASYELKLERDGRYADFEALCEAELGAPWSELKSGDFAEEDFSQLMHKLFPERFDAAQAWFLSHGGASHTHSAEDCVRDIDDMLAHRAPEATLFIVIDEVSQYIHQDESRMLKLQSFASALGARLLGRVWLLALGQQKLEADGGQVLSKMQDRFPKRLRVHLGSVNIRDVVHQRLLRKTPEGERWLQEQWSVHGHALELYAWWERGQDKRCADFVETYPLMPGHIDLLMRITSALRTRSARARGDDQAIRGLLQLLGELFRQQQLADRPAGTLVTLDEVYEVQHTALDADTQRTMQRVLTWCRGGGVDELAEKAAKAVALLELIQDQLPTTAELVARCLYDRVDRGDRGAEVEAALERLKRENLLGFREKTGYRIQSSAGEEWERERRDIRVGQKERSALIQEALSQMVSTDVTRPQHQGRPFAWRVLFSDGRQAVDVPIVATRDLAAVEVDLRFLTREEASSSVWIKRSSETALKHRLLWVCGPVDAVEELARELGRSASMVRRYNARGELPQDKRRLLVDEQGRAEDLQRALTRAVEEAWMSGQLYFRGVERQPRDLAPRASGVLMHQGAAVLPELFPHFEAAVLTAGELQPLLDDPINGPSPKLTEAGLGLVGQEPGTGRWEATCTGPLPQRVLGHVRQEGGASGEALLQHFGRAPYGYHPSVIKACCAALLRARQLEARTAAGKVTSRRDAGARELIEKERDFRQAEWFEGAENLDKRALRKLAKLIEQTRGSLSRDPDPMADAVADRFPARLAQLREVLTWLERMGAHTPHELDPLQELLEKGVQKARRTQEVLGFLTAPKRLNDLEQGLGKLDVLRGDLGEDAVAAVLAARKVRDNQLAQLNAASDLEGPLAAAAQRVEDQLASPAPWRGVKALDADLELLIEAYGQERQARVALQGRLADSAREQVKATSEEWSLLSADQHNEVLRPIRQHSIDTEATAVQPALDVLTPERLAANLRAGKAAAIRELDAILERLKRVPIEAVDLRSFGRSRKLTTEAEVKAVVGELEALLMEEIRRGRHVRLS